MIADRTITDILLDLHEKSRSGILRITKNSKKKQFVLIKGLLAFAESNLPEEHLAKIMIRLGLLHKSKLPEIADLMKRGHSSEEAILEVIKDAPSVNRLDIERARRKQAVSILAALMAWSDYDVRFFAGHDLVRCRLFVGLALPDLLVESARDAVDRRLIRMPEHFLQSTCSVIRERAGKAALLPLNSLESFLYSRAKEPVPVADMFSGLTPENAARPDDALIFLSLLGLIRIEDAARPDGLPSGTENSGFSLQALQEILLRMEQSDLYTVMGVAEEVSQDQIQSAYHILAKQYHPDRFQSKECSGEIRVVIHKIFAAVNAAYLTLKDPASRAAYNKSRVENKSRAATGTKDPADDERTAEAMFVDGKSMIVGKEFEKAAELLKGAVLLRPDKAAYHHYLGVALSELPNSRKAAEQHLLKALELDFLSMASRIALARLYATVMLRKKAITQLGEVLRWDPDNKEARKLMKTLSPGFF
ncbi:MAG TPA: DnaJ domain-containing protein [Acidobacteriota bacterium]|nr:DnaJ domain-containing protein [Acidobacteriota bacterium]